MKQIAVVLAGILLAGTAHAGDVYVTKDGKGNTVYTDTPQTLPAQKVAVQSQGSSQPAAAQQDAPGTQDQASQKSEAQPAEARQAAADSAADRAKRCAEARQQYQNVMNSRRLYEEGPNGERTYLTSEQIDKTRANSKEVMDQFCSGQ